MPRGPSALQAEVPVTFVRSGTTNHGSQRGPQSRPLVALLGSARIATKPSDTNKIKLKTYWPARGRASSPLKDCFGAMSGKPLATDETSGLQGLGENRELRASLCTALHTVAGIPRKPQGLRLD